MCLVSGSQLLVAARDDGYAVGAFNISNLEIAQAVFEAAGETRSPVMVATSQSAIEYAGIRNIHSLVDNLASEAGIPAALHLDHGTELNAVAACINNGWTSVMIDGSRHPFDENVEITRRVVAMARPHGISVEAELGRLVGVEDDVSIDEREASLTDPAEAAEFVERTDCDSLAVAVGTSHGAYKFKSEPELAIDRLCAIAEVVSVPLVLHGASAVPPEVLSLAERYGAKLEGARGVPPESIRRAIEAGISKVNIDTDLRLAFTGRIRQLLAESPEIFDPRKLLAAAREGIKDVVVTKMMLFGSAGKA